MKKLFNLFAAVCVLVSVASPSFAANQIAFSPGGSIIEFIEKFNADRQAESKYILDGPCLSACTLITALIDNENVCSTKRGLLGFHSAYTMTPVGPMHSEGATKLIGMMLPDEIAAKVKERGFDIREGQEHPDLVYIKALEIYKACNHG